MAHYATAATFFPISWALRLRVERFGSAVPTSVWWGTRWWATVALVSCVWGTRSGLCVGFGGFFLNTG
jgi:hypothetical protein